MAKFPEDWLLHFDYEYHPTSIDVTAKTEEFVRCKDCKYYEPPNGMDKQNFTCKLLFDVEREEDDYCSYGERK